MRLAAALTFEFNEANSETIGRNAVLTIVVSGVERSYEVHNLIIPDSLRVKVSQHSATSRFAMRVKLCKM